MRKRLSFRTGLLWVMGVGLLGIVCAAGLALHDIHVSPVVTAALRMSSIWVPTVLCWTAVYRVRLRRPEILLAAAPAVTSWAVGSTYYVALQPAAGTVPFPTFPVVGSALFYTLMAAALLVAAHRQARGVASSVWWGAAVGSLGAAAVLVYQAKNAGRNVVRQALERVLLMGAHHAVGRAVSLQPGQAQ
jgi:hypothetical protein